MLFKESLRTTDGRRTKTDHNSFGSGELKIHSMNCGKTSGNIACLLSNSEKKKWKSAVLKKNFHFRTSNVCNFFISEQKHKMWAVIFLVRTEQTFWY